MIEKVVHGLNKLFPVVDYANWSECERLIAHVQSILKLAEEKNLDSKEAGTLATWAGKYLNDQGKYASAEPFYSRTLTICEKMLGPEHPGTALSLNNLAALYADQGKYEEAEPLYSRALGIFEKAHGSEHPSTRTVRNNLAEFRKRKLH